MRKIICEVCGSQSIKKENDVFVCQNCGIEYSLDEIKKLFNPKTESSDKEPNQKTPVKKTVTKKEPVIKTKTTTKTKNLSPAPINKLVTPLDVFGQVISLDHVTSIPSYLSRYEGKTSVFGVTGKNYLIDGKAYHKIQGFKDVGHIGQMFLFNVENSSRIYVFMPICPMNHAIASIIKRDFSQELYNLECPGSFTDDIFVDNLKNRYSLVNDNYLVLHTAFEYKNEEDLLNKVKTIYAYSNSIITFLADHALKYPFLTFDCNNLKTVLKSKLKTLAIN